MRPSAKPEMFDADLPASLMGEWGARKDPHFMAVFHFLPDSTNCGDCGMRRKQ